MKPVWLGYTFVLMLFCLIRACSCRWQDNEMSIEYLYPAVWLVFFFFFCIANPASPLVQCWSQHFVDKEHEHLIHVPTVVGIDSTIEPSNKVAIASIREQRKRPLQDEDGLVNFLTIFQKKRETSCYEKKGW